MKLTLKNANRQEDIIDIIRHNNSQIQFAFNTLSNKIKLTEEGGIAVKLVNKTGANSIKGIIVAASTINNDSFVVPTNQFNRIGIVYEAGVPDGSNCWVVQNGIADALLQNNSTSVTGNWVRASTVLGRVYAETASTNVATLASTEMLKQIGYSVQNVTASVNEQTARVVLHL